MMAAIIDHLQEGMPGVLSNKDLETRADVFYQYVETQTQSAAVH